MLRAGTWDKNRDPKALRKHAIDEQRSPGTAGQPEITQDTSTPRARAAGQPYRGGLTGELPSTPSTQRARLDAVDETHNIAP